MAVTRHCACDLPNCPHPQFAPDDPVCKNWPETVDIYCNDCRQRRQSLLAEIAKALLDSK